jgi:hypothetical protein
MKIRVVKKQEYRYTDGAAEKAWLKESEKNNIIFRII